MNKKNQHKKQAVALRYNAKVDESPQLIGKGTGLLAEDIITKAKEHNIPIQEEATLVEVLSQLELNQKIPSELYEVVAEVFAFIYRIDRNG